MQILRALWEQRPPQLYGRVQCPVLMLPAAQEPKDEREAAFLARKRANIALAEQMLADSETVWFQDTVHDIPIHRPRELADVITQFTRRHSL